MLCYYLGSLRQQNLSRAVRFLLLPRAALFFITSVIFYLVGVVHCLCHLFIKASVNLIQKICPKCICNAVPSFIRRSWFCGIRSRKKRPKPRLLLESHMPYSLSCSSALGSLLLANVLFSHKHGADATSCCRNSSMPPSRELPPAKPRP